MYFIQNYNIEKKANQTENSATVSNKVKSDNEIEIVNSEIIAGIKDMTEENMIISYVKRRKTLPDYYLTKSEARKKGWVPSKGNLCDILPGNAIGGDKFSNREKHLPSGNQYFEADVNYNCGNRNANRIVFTKNGEVWLTKDHYKSFKKK